jgi:PBSX family phage terminase large subunit
MARNRRSNGTFAKGVYQRELYKEVLEKTTHHRRKLTFVEQTLIKTQPIKWKPNGDFLNHDGRKILLYEWLQEVHIELTLNGKFHAPNEDKYIYFDDKDSVEYVNHLLKNVMKDYDNMAFKDVVLLHKYISNEHNTDPIFDTISKIVRNTDCINSLIDTLTSNTKMRGWQREAVDRTEYIVFLHGGRGRGATTVMVAMAIMKAIKYPNLTLPFFRKFRETTRVSLFASSLHFLCDNEFLLKLVRHVDKTKMTINLHNNSTLLFKGMANELQQEQSKGTASSSGLGSGDSGAVVDEAVDFTADNIDTILNNIRGDTLKPNSQIIFATNPSHPKHHIRQKFLMGEVIETTKEGGKIRVYANGGDGKEFRSIEYMKTAKDNEALMEVDPGYYERLGAIKGVKRLRDQLGQWCLAEGAIYPSFNPKYHVKPFTESEVESLIRNADKLYIGADFGMVDATAILWLALNYEVDSETSKKIPHYTLYRQLYLWGCKTDKVADFIVTNYPETKGVFRFIAGHDSKAQIETLCHLGVNAMPNRGKSPKASLNQKRYAMTGFKKEYAIPSIDTLFRENRLTINSNGVIPHYKLNDLKIMGWSEKTNAPLSLQDEIPTLTWVLDGKEGGLVEKIKDGNDHAHDGLCNVIFYEDLISNRNLDARAHKRYTRILEDLQLS